ncbi:MAG: dihydrofolate reductase family protein, partial [Peptococcaceae bacterium]
MAVYFYGCVSLDGYLATKEHDLSWLYDTGTTADTGYEAFYEQMDMTLMGRRTFDEVATLAVPAEAYPTTDNVVFTHQSLDCEGVRAVCADPVTFVKAQDGQKNIWVVGGNTILAPLLDADLVDVLIIQVAPVLLGAGIPLFAQKEALH